MSELLREGDVIEIALGHTVYIALPYHFVYDNRWGVFDQVAESAVTIGSVRKGLDTSQFVGRYVVTGTSQEGGGTGMGPHDVYPDGHRVRCVSVEPGKEGLRLNFYQTGAFTAMIPDITPIGRATATWRLTPPSPAEGA